MVATTVEEAVAAAAPLIEQSGNPVVVVKSQIHAGGRGKGTFQEHSRLARRERRDCRAVKGGTAAAEEEVVDLAQKMLGSTLVTIQTGPSRASR